MTKTNFSKEAIDFKVSKKFANSHGLTTINQIEDYARAISGVYNMTLYRETKTMYLLLPASWLSWTAAGPVVRKTRGGK